MNSPLTAITSQECVESVLAQVAYWIGRGLFFDQAINIVSEDYHIDPEKVRYFVDAAKGQGVFV